MGQIAFVFSGQGAQYSGMGQSLYESCSQSAELFQRADAIRPGTSAQCFSGTAEELAQTRNTQPCLFVMELAAAAAAEASGLRPDLVAGFSLGELAALTYAGVFSFEEGFRLVCLRGELMHAETEKTETAMVAVLKLDAETVEQLCANYEQVYPVNYNCPGQISVSGRKDALAEFSKAVKAAGGRAVPLRVAGAFHSPFMAPAAEKFALALGNANFQTPDVPVYSDYTGHVYGEDFAETLAQQISHPVRWQTIVMDMIQNGVDTFVELGPGKTLCGLIGKTDATVKTLHIEDVESLQQTVKECQHG